MPGKTEKHAGVLLLYYCCITGVFLVYYNKMLVLPSGESASLAHVHVAVLKKSKIATKSISKQMHMKKLIL